MSKPDWFNLIAQWKHARMGDVGPTLPFVVGALGHKANRYNLNSHDVRNVLNAMIEDPVEGYVTQVSCCPDIGAPVLTVGRLSPGSDQSEWPMPLKSYFPRPDGKEKSLGFSDNVQSGSGGLGCNNAHACFEKLVLDAEAPVKEGRYSRLRAEDGAYTYGAFREWELEYIRKTIM